jgi:hypothetical protein
MVSEIRGRTPRAGTQFVLATDVRFASDKAVLGQLEVGVGAAPGGGPMARQGGLARGPGARRTRGVRPVHAAHGPRWRRSRDGGGGAVAASGTQHDVVDVVRKRRGARRTGSFLVSLDVP